MAVKYGPTRGELQFRLFVGIVILIMVAVTIATKGLPSGLLNSEMVLLGTLFGGGTVVFSAYKLIKGLYREG